MQLQQLKYVIEVSKTGSMNKAAHNLYISQPNLSSAISNLEKELNITIFNRTNKGVEITPEGTLLLRYARSIIGQVDQIKSIYNDDNSETTSVLNISLCKSIFLTKAIGNIYNQFNNTIQISLNIRSVSDVIKDVFNQVSDIGIISVSNSQQSIVDKMLDQKKLEFIPLSKSNVCIIVGKSSSLCSYDKVTISDICHLPFIDYLQESSAPIKYCVELSEIWSDYSSSISVNDSESLRNILNLMDSYSFDLIANKNYLESKGVKCIELKDDVEINIGFIKRKKEPLSFEGQLFIDEASTIYGYK